MTWRILGGDCIETMRGMDEASVDAIVTDPPYGLGFMGKDWDSPGGTGDFPMRRTTAANTVNTGASRQGGRQRSTEDFQKRQARDARSYQAWTEAWATEALRVLKPGGHLLAFGGARTYHRLAAGVENAGFEVRDCIAWMYSTGFPKSLNLDRFACQCEMGESTDGAAQTEHDVSRVRGRDVPTPVGAGAGQGPLLLEGVSEPSASATGREQLRSAEVRASEPSVEGRSDAETPEGELLGSPLRESASVGAADGTGGRLHHGAPAGDRGVGGSPADADGSGEPRRPQPGEQRSGESGTVADEPGPQAGGAWPLCPRCSQPRFPRGLGTALKPAFEPIVVARKSLVGTVAQNVAAHGTGALNIDGTRIEGEGYVYPNGPRGNVTATSYHLPRREEPVESHPSGRWPANVVLDEEAARMLDEQTGELVSGPESDRGHRRNADREAQRNAYGGFQGQEVTGVLYGDRGGASRFFLVVPTEDNETWPASDVNTAEPSSRPSSEPAGTAPSDAATSLSPEGEHSHPSSTAPSTSATPSGSRLSAASDTELTPSTAERFSPEQQPASGDPISPASDAERGRPTDTTTTTASRSRSDTSAGDATSATTPPSSAPGAKGYDEPTRFRYCPKADREERNRGVEHLPSVRVDKTHSHSDGRVWDIPGSHSKPRQNHHPTVKPVALMQWLCRLITPPGGLVLDPFTGSGSTGIAALREGFSFLGIEREADYVEIARARIIGDAPLFNAEEAIR